MLNDYIDVILIIIISIILIIIIIIITVSDDSWASTITTVVQEFIENLIAAIPALDENSVKYPYPLPTPYMCQLPDSCERGMDSPCADGYEGPVCAICSLDY